MAITLELTPAAEALLSDLAEQDGQDKKTVASSLLAAALEHAAHEREVKAVLCGMEDSRAGRARPLAEWDAEFRAKYNIPANLEPLSEEELSAFP